VQSNFGGVLTINGAPVGRELDRYYLKDDLKAQQPAPQSIRENYADGSAIVVIATDAPVDSRNLRRMAARAMMGLARTGAAGSNGSGDYAIAFSSEGRTRPTPANEKNVVRTVKSLSNDSVSPLFLAVIEATEEAVYNSLFKATTTSGNGHTVEALPLDRTIELLRKHGLLMSNQ